MLTLNHDSCIKPYIHAQVKFYGQDFSKAADYSKTLSDIDKISNFLEREAGDNQSADRIK